MIEIKISTVKYPYLDTFYLDCKSNKSKIKKDLEDICYNYIEKIENSIKEEINKRS